MVLLVEDEALVAMLLETILEDMGCVPVGPAGTVEEGLAALPVHPILFNFKSKNPREADQLFAILQASGRDSAPSTAHCCVVKPSSCTARLPVLCNILAH